MPYATPGRPCTEDKLSQSPNIGGPHALPPGPREYSEVPRPPVTPGLLAPFQMAVHANDVDPDLEDNPN